MKLQALALAFLAATAIGGVAWVFIYPLLSGEKQAENRRASVAKPEPAAKRQAERTQRSRREQVEGTLKDLEARRQSQRKVPLSVRLTQAGLDWSIQKFMVVSAAIGGVFFALAMFVGGGLLGAAGLAFAGGFGLPRWGLGFLKKRREKAFLKALPELRLAFTDLTPQEIGRVAGHVAGLHGEATLGELVHAGVDEEEVRFGLEVTRQVREALWNDGRDE